MKRATLLLFDSTSSLDLSLDLRRSFESRSGTRFELCHEVLEPEKPDENHLKKTVSSVNPDIILLVIPNQSLRHYRPVIEALRGIGHAQPIVIVIGKTDSREMIDGLLLGAADFLTPPLNAATVLPRIWQFLKPDGYDEQREQSWKTLGPRLIGESPLFVAEVEKLSKVADCDASVLISGETGTGKEVFATAIHYLSPRADKVFIPVNCGAIPVELVENELFGHERGAFTGASSSRGGLIQEAAGGTLFLDEIDSLSLMAQVKLLRFLQEREYRPLGSARTLKADVRIITASSTNLDEAVEAGKLRRDLYYRLNVITIAVPPLRQRPEDIIPLAKHFLARYAAAFDKPARYFSPNAIFKLTSYHWPGNVRELEHTVERAVVLSTAEAIDSNHIALSDSQTTSAAESFQKAKARIINQFEKNYLRTVLRAHNGNITRAASSAKKDRRAFVQLMRKHKIDVNELKPHASVYSGGREIEP